MVSKMSEGRIFYGGSIITMNDDDPSVEAVGIKEDKIVAVGGFTKIKQKLPNAELINLNGNTLLPGFHDCHCHALAYVFFLSILNLRHIKNYKDFTEFYSQDENDHSNSPVWVRNSFFEGNPDFWKGNIVVHGHTPTQKMQYYCNLPPEEKEDHFSKLTTDYYIADLPFLRKHSKNDKIVSINIDTGVANGRRLTALGISADNFKKTEKGTFLKLEIIQIDGQKGFSSDETFKFFEYMLNID